MKKMSTLLYSKLLNFRGDEDLDNYCYDRFGILEEMPYKFQLPVEDNTKFYDACLERCKQFEGSTFCLTSRFGVYLAFIMIENDIKFNLYSMADKPQKQVFDFFKENNIKFVERDKIDKLVITAYGNVLFRCKRSGVGLNHTDNLHTVGEIIEGKKWELSVRMIADYYLAQFGLDANDFETYEDLVRFFDCCFGYYAFGSIRTYKIGLDMAQYKCFFNTQKFTNIWFTQFLNICKTGGLALELEMVNYINKFVDYDLPLDDEIPIFRKRSIIVREPEF